ncbi:hypothetical protein ADK88_13890 [Streptomyces sp. NRRL F-2295]|nr:hypothetical protein ADK88_13890 [Streptomyces sp. NRRL F-2295]
MEAGTAFAEVEAVSLLHGAEPGGWGGVTGGDRPAAGAHHPSLRAGAGGAFLGAGAAAGILRAGVDRALLGAGAARPRGSVGAFLGAWQAGRLGAAGRLRPAGLLQSVGAVLSAGAAKPLTGGGAAGLFGGIGLLVHSSTIAPGPGSRRSDVGRQARATVGPM